MVYPTNGTWKLYLPVVDMARDILISFITFFFGNYWLIQHVAILSVEISSLAFEIKANIYSSKYFKLRIRTIKALFILYILLNMLCNIDMEGINKQIYLGLAMLIVLILLLSVDVFTTCRAIYIAIAKWIKSRRSKIPRQNFSNGQKQENINQNQLNRDSKSAGTHFARIKRNELTVKSVMRFDRFSVGGSINKQSSSSKNIAKNRLNAEEDSNNNTIRTTTPCPPLLSSHPSNPTQSAPLPNIPPSNNSSISSNNWTKKKIFIR